MADVAQIGTYHGQAVQDYVRPAQLVDTLIETGASKATLPLAQMFVRGMLGGAFLAYGTSMAFFGIAQGMIPILAALLFPTGFIIINTIQADLATGYFCFVPMAWLHGRMSFGDMLKAFFWVYVANLVGSLIYVGLLWAAITNFGATADATGISAVAMKIALAKTTKYTHLGLTGEMTAFVKGILCNWFVTLGVVLPYATRSIVGKAILTYVPIYMFFSMGWEHLIVNMFVIPTGMVFGAPITMSDWWIGNELPVTIGNFVGGFVFTGLAIGWTYFARPTPADALTAVVQPARP